MKKILIVALFLMLAVWSKVLFAEEDAAPMGFGQEGAGQQFEGFNLEGYTDDGEKDWDVEGDTADINGSEIILTNVNANTYGGESKMNVVAKLGTINQVTGNMELEEDVVITTEDGSQLVTESLQWSRKNDLVSTEDPVMINNKQLMVTGNGLEAKPGLSRVKIKQDVKVLVEPEPENHQVVTITSDGPMTIDQIKFKARFEDNVVATQDDQTLKADILEVYFGENMGSIQKMVCIGNVEVMQGGNRSFAQEAVYDAVTKKLTLSGRPKLILDTEGDNVFTATGD